MAPGQAKSCSGPVEGRDSVTDAPTPSSVARIVDEAMQEQFAALSGDRNPMHMDAVAARRTQAGMRVVHGIHTLLWALEMAVEAGYVPPPSLRVQAKFLKWVYLGEEAVMELTPLEPSGMTHLSVEVHRMPVLSVTLMHADTSAVPSAFTEARGDEMAPRLTALTLSVSDVKGRRGQGITPASDDVAALFPALCKWIGPTAVAEIAATSYIVGMEVPGMFSVFSKLDLTLTQAPVSATRVPLAYQVLSCDERFRKARIAVKGLVVQGVLDVFVRVPPVAQNSIKELFDRVGPTEFAGMRALVIGGSRGLGELTAKLVAAGGGAPTITYVIGRSDATRVAEEVRKEGCSIEYRAYDVCLEPGAQLSGEGRFTHLFYFATNPIFRSKQDLVSAPILTEFILFYLQGFHDICAYLTQQKHVHRNQDGKLIAYYPSSIAVDDRPAGMTEYAMIKAAGEQMCRDMNMYMDGIQVYTSRLPRLLTDQTASLLPERETDPVDVLLPIVRKMQQLSMQNHH